MTELLVRAGAQDARLLHDAWAGRGADAAPWLPDRLVLDAHVATSTPSLQSAARRAGVPVLIDPQTYYLQDTQHGGDPWSRLTFATPDALTPAMADQRFVERLVDECLDYQLARGATMLIPPYVHIDRADDGWLPVQLALWRSTAHHVERHRLQVPLLAVTALGWRLLSRHAWPQALQAITHALTELPAAEVALAASKVDAGAHPEARLADLVATTRRLRRAAPVIAWSQGVLGEAAVAAGAIGYETGLGWRERCDIPSAKGGHRRPRHGGGGPRPVYLPAIKRSIPKGHLEALLGDPRFAPDLLCPDSHCCPHGRRSLLSDARLHALRSRAASLRTISQAERPSWRWGALEVQTSDAVDLVRRINRAAGRRSDGPTIDDTALRAMQAVAENRRHTLRRRAA